MLSKKMLYSYRIIFLRFSRKKYAELFLKAAQDVHVHFFCCRGMGMHRRKRAGKFLCFAQNLSSCLSACSFRCDFLYPFFLLHGKPLHQPCELFRRDLPRLGRCPGPPETSRFQPFIDKQKPIPFPQQSLDPVSTPATK